MFSGGLDADSAQVPPDPAIVGGRREGGQHRFAVAIGILAAAERVVQIGSPLCRGHQARLNQREPVEESSNAGGVTRDERRVPVQFLGNAEKPGGRFGVGFAGHVAKSQVAAWRHRVPELPDDPPRVFLIPQAMQRTHEHDPDRLAEVEQVAYLRVAEHLLRFAKIRSERDDVGAGHQRRGMGRDQRILIHVDDARLGRHPVGDLVSVGHVRQARAEVEELADALAEHVVNHPLQ